MIIAKSLVELKNALSVSGTIGFVPTMGCLHEGHASLVKKSRSDTDFTVVSIYVNQTQFNNALDLANYPSTLDRDVAMLQNLGVDLLFLPTYELMYPDDYQIRVVESVESLDRCGRSRPGHFDGVLTVVLKLFHLIRPSYAYFGEKDRQQLELIQKMVRAFFIDVKIVACATVRDESGLALSSRNERLSPQGLAKAREFANKLRHTRDLNELAEQITRLGGQVDYIEDVGSHRYAAIFIEGVRLIDNVAI